MSGFALNFYDVILFHSTCCHYQSEWSCLNSGGGMNGQMFSTFFSLFFFLFFFLFILTVFRRLDGCRFKGEG